MYGVFCPQSSPEAPGWPHTSHLMAGFRQVGLENLGEVTELVLSSLGEGHTPQGDCPAAQGPLPHHWHCWANSKEVGTEWALPLSPGTSAPLPIGSAALRSGWIQAPHPLFASQLFIDKDTIVNAVGASHDIHLLKIDNREDELVTRVNSWCTHLLDKVSRCVGRAGGRISPWRPGEEPHVGGGGAHSGTGSRSSCPQIHKDEIMRNRKRVKEINQYIDHVQSELDSLEYGDLLD